nr:MAG TPA: hypothetical protein [Caudoviricetes sp.]
MCINHSKPKLYPWTFANVTTQELAFLLKLCIMVSS